MKRLLAAVNGYRLYREGEFYQVESIRGESMVNTSGTKCEVRQEMERWKDEIDANNPFMLEIENAFILALS